MSDAQHSPFCSPSGNRKTDEDALILEELCRDHPHETPELIAAVLGRARKNVLTDDPDKLRREVALLFELLVAWRGEAERS